MSQIASFAVVRSRNDGKVHTERKLGAVMNGRMRVLDGVEEREKKQQQLE